MKKTLIIFSLIMLFACSQESDVSQEKFVQIYKEILIARESTSDTEKGTSNVNEVFEKYNISESQFRDMFMKLSAEDPKRLTEMIDSVRIYTEVEIKKIDSLNGKSKMEKDTNTSTQSDK